MTSEERRQAREEEARLRKEYFDRGGVVRRYPMGHSGGRRWELASHWGRAKINRERKAREGKRDGKGG